MQYFWEGISRAPAWTTLIWAAIALLVQNSFGLILLSGLMCLWPAALAYDLEQKFDFISAKIERYCLTCAFLIAMTPALVPNASPDDAAFTATPALIAFCAYVFAVWRVSGLIVTLQKKSFQETDDQELVFGAFFFLSLGGAFWISKRVSRLNPVL